MNGKMIKEKTSKQNFWISFKQSKTQLQQTQLVCTANTQHQKCCGTRQNVREHKGVTFILDCYNAAPDSMKASLSVLAQTEAKGKRYCVLGDMLELGKNSAKYHKQVGEYVLSSKADEILCFGENSVHYIEGACDKGFAAENARHFDSREELAAYLKGKLNAGDAVLIKGSRGMKLEEVFNILTAE